MSKDNRLRLGTIAKYVMIVFTIAFTLYPLFYSFLTSLKSKEGYIIDPIGISFSRLTLENYRNIIKNFNFLQKLGNTSFVVLVSMIILLNIALPVAYYVTYLAKKSFRKVLVVTFFAFMFIPEEVLILPEYNMMSSLGLVNNFLSVIFLFVSSSLPEVIFLICAYFPLIPSELIAAAKLDGANEFDCLIKVVAPLTRGSILVVMITTAISLWNSFLLPMLLLFDERHKLLLPSLSGLITKHSTSPTYQMAGIQLAMLPLTIVYFFFRKRIFENSMGGALK